MDNKYKPSAFKDDYYKRSESYNYVSFYYSTERQFDWASYLVGKVICQIGNLRHHIEDEDIILHFLITRFIDTLSTKQIIDFALIFDLLFKKSNTNHQLKTNDPLSILWKILIIASWFVLNYFPKYLYTSFCNWNKKCISCSKKHVGTPHWQGHKFIWQEPK